MIGRIVSTVIAATLFIMMSACSRTAPEAVATAPLPIGVEDAEKLNTMKPMKQVRILVGGCRDACSEPGLAATRFLEATAGKAPQVTAGFLNSTSLVLDGERLGERWVRLWKELKPATRKAEITKTAGGLSSWASGLTRDQVREALTSGLKPVKVWTSEAVFSFKSPGRPWRIVLEPRGLEWLVVELDRIGDSR